MLKKRYIIIALAIVSTLLGSFLVHNIILAQSGGEYDPWLDYNEDGTIDVNDLSPMGQAYGSSGDPTKNVSVTNWPPIQEVAVINWPAREEITVWFDEPVSTGSPLVSPDFYAEGFGQLHLLMKAFNLTGSESITLYVGASLWNYDHTAYYVIIAAEFDMNIDTTQYAVTMPVPSNEFYFWAYAGPATSCEVSLRLYLTWA